MEATNQVSSLINWLTNDEDKRQELWLYYLEGNELPTLASHLYKLENSYSADYQIQVLLWDAFKNPPSDKFKVLLSHFSEIERQIVCLLALGLSISQISGYKGISEIRIKQVISIIRENDCWEELYGTEKETNR